MKETDLISRSDAIKTIYGICNAEDTENPHVDVIVDELGNLPSAQRWTFVIDSQPKEEGEYLVRWSNAYTSAKDVAVWDGDDWWTADTMSLCMTGEVDAWIAIPEPYEGVEE